MTSQKIEITEEMLNAAIVAVGEAMSDGENATWIAGAALRAAFDAQHEYDQRAGRDGASEPAA